MTAYQHKGLSFDVPEGWVDRTVLAFAAPTADSEPTEPTPNVVIAREELAAEDTLRTHADRTLLDMAKTLEGFDILESREMMLGGLRAVHVRFKWTSSAGELEQGMTMCEAPRQVGDKSRFATMITSSAHVKSIAKVRPSFESLLNSIRFGVGGEGAGVPPSVREPPPDSNPLFGARRR